VLDRGGKPFRVVARRTVAFFPWRQCRIIIAALLFRVASSPSGPPAAGPRLDWFLAFLDFLGGRSIAARAPFDWFHSRVIRVFTPRAVRVVGGLFRQLKRWKKIPMQSTSRRKSVPARHFCMTRGNENTPFRSIVSESKRVPAARNLPAEHAIQWAAGFASRTKNPVRCQSLRAFALSLLEPASFRVQNGSFPGASM